MNASHIDMRWQFIEVVLRMKGLALMKRRSDGCHESCQLTYRRAWAKPYMAVVSDPQSVDVCKGIPGWNMSVGEPRRSRTCMLTTILLNGAEIKVGNDFIGAIARDDPCTQPFPSCVIDDGIDGKSDLVKLIVAIS